LPLSAPGEKMLITPVRVKNVAKSSGTGMILSDIRESFKFILDRSLIYVMNVAKESALKKTQGCEEYSKGFIVFQLWSPTKEPMLKSTIVNVVSGARPSFGSQHLVITKKPTLERNPINVKT
uniref:Uncharacterized protein n=1 Tax=Equus caballus TaxID=9796 RepID=A0A9L0TKS5_HORSE